MCACVCVCVCVCVHGCALQWKHTRTQEIEIMGMDMNKPWCGAAGARRNRKLLSADDGGGDHGGGDDVVDVHVTRLHALAISIHSSWHCGHALASLSLSRSLSQ